MDKKCKSWPETLRFEGEEIKVAGCVMIIKNWFCQRA